MSHVSIRRADECSEQFEEAKRPLLEHLIVHISDVPLIERNTRAALALHLKSSQTEDGQTDAYIARVRASVANIPPLRDALEGFITQLPQGVCTVPEMQRKLLDLLRQGDRELRLHSRLHQLSIKPNLESFVAMVNGRIVGMASYDKHDIARGGVAQKLGIDGRRVFELRGLVVLPDYEGKGIGHALQSSIVKEIRRLDPQAVILAFSRNPKVLRMHGQIIDLKDALLLELSAGYANGRSDTELEVEAEHIAADMEPHGWKGLLDMSQER